VGGEVDKKMKELKELDDERDKRRST